MKCAYCGEPVSPDEVTWVNNRFWHLGCYEDKEMARYETASEAEGLE